MDVSKEYARDAAEEAYNLPSPQRFLEEVVIVDAVRTPFGRNSKPSGIKAALQTLLLTKNFSKAKQVLAGDVAKGALQDLSPIDLAAQVLTAIVERQAGKLSPSQIEDVVLGCAVQKNGQGVNIARNAVLATEFPDEVAGVTVNRLCGSGLQAVNQAYQGIACGEIEVAIAGGVEHMNAAPMLSDFDKTKLPERQRVSPGHNQILGAQIIAKEYGFSRELLDQFALESQEKYEKAFHAGKYNNDIVGVDLQTKAHGRIELDRDEHPRRTSFKALSRLKPVFKEQIGNEMITAGMSSGVVDGASAVLLMSREKAAELGLKPRARIIASAAVGSDPLPMLTGPIASSRKALQLAGLEVQQIDRWEINEAFAPVVLAVMQDLKIEPEKVNVWGGAIAHGHPLGATGAALLGKVVSQLEETNLRYGCVTLCIGMGQGISTVVERLD